MTGSDERNGTVAPAPGRKARRVKIADIASAAGVHPSTVSRVLRADPRGRISESVAERVREMAKTLGYRPDAVAASLRTGSTQTIGVIVHDIEDPVYPPILRGIEQRLLERGFMTVVGNTGYDPHAEAEMFEQMANRMVDGVILGTTRLQDPVVQRAQELGVPLVSVLRSTEHLECSAVVNDCASGMRELVDAVVAHGHRDIAVIAAPQDLSTARDRLSGLRAGLAAHGLEVPEERLFTVERMDVEAGRRAASTLLERRPDPPQVIMAVNDLVAIGAIQACRARGLRVPDDISITGYNDIPLVDMIDPPLTTVAMNLSEIGMRSADCLLDRLSAPEAEPQLTRVRPELRLRESLATIGR
ncbi:transcriptional regulator, LacI family [Roseivivax lentus]|uniref:Transcriptional regulator, LacI family n=1 Tax=Roseivivax lentus TaxID=633194 RepID=A0A1N7LVQ8_9RHOB|nr:LacI family DNA-binding transcriptional regulator [Roseivivax lentus]SIS77938.1 transcriptional regulator, LacI family [Roseivivax lentus]